MYVKYHTDALVLSSKSSGESDKVLTLYTKDFGLVRARATALRLERSRMRYSVSELSYAHVSLVRGMRGWRLAGANSRRVFASVNLRAAGAWVRISQLVERLVKGEEANEYLFSTLVDAHATLSDSSDETWMTIELVCVARVLYALGYLSAEALDTALFTHTAYGVHELKEAEARREPLLSSVNKALSETQL